MARKLTIRTKLAAALAVPLVALAAFAAFQVRDAYDRADQVKREAALATSATGPSGVVDALVTERDFETYRVLGLEKRAAGLGVKNSRQAQDTTDSRVGAFRSSLRSLGAEVAGSYTPALAQVGIKLDGDNGLRAQIEDLAAKAGLQNAKAASSIFNGYSDLIDGLLDADQQSAARIDDGQIAAGVGLLNALNRQNDIESRIVIETALVSVSHDPVLALDVQGLAGIQTRGEEDLRTRADGIYARAIAGPIDAPARQAAVSAMHAAARDPLHAQLDTLVRIPHGAGLLHVAVSNVAGIVSERSTTLTAAAQDQQRNWLAVTIGCVLLAIAMLWLSNRWITRPLRSLTDQATAMAGTLLPAAVQQVLQTPLTDDVDRPDLEPISVSAGGEIREVADALNRVQDSAVELAVEQASLRRNVADAYVNLGRRNQNLLSRQLEFITQLENDESDPETLEHLFKLDHLATRMRRNAESLLVLAGLAPPRTWGAPVPIGDVVRGALGEVEGYQRVRLRHLDDARVDGTAAADVSHVVAELTENALAFSPPDAEVEIYGRLDEVGYVLTIVDSGIGMPSEDLERANALLAAPETHSFAPSRFLGHYVVSQLAARHDLAVYLASSPTGGLTAMIALPGVLVGMRPVVAELVDDDAEPAVEPEAERPAAALPRRGEAAADAAAPAPVDAREFPPAARPEPVGAPPVDRPPVIAPVIALAPLLRPTEPAAEVEPEPEPPAEAPAPRAPLVISDRHPRVAPLEPSTPVADVAPVEASPVEAALVEVVPVEVAPVEVASPVAPDETAPAEVVAEPAPEPPRPRIGIGSFADLRAAPPARPVARPEPAPVDPVPAAAAPAPPVVPAVHPEVDTVPAPDHRASFAEVAEAVDVAVTSAPVDTPPAVVYSEDLLPSKLPKRGRRSARLGTPWTREKPAQMPAPAPATASPTGPAAPDDAQFSAPASNGNGADHDPVASSEPPANAAFFAAFRAAAERAREEAGIDDRRVGH